MDDILGTLCLLVVFISGLVIGVVVVYDEAGIIGVVIATMLFAITVLLYCKGKI